eukprot:7388671-Prymnesium_polylepis.1
MPLPLAAAAAAAAACWHCGGSPALSALLVETPAHSPASQIASEFFASKAAPPAASRSPAASS